MLNLEKTYYAAGRLWYYDEPTGLYYVNPEHIGMGCTIWDIEAIEDIQEDR